MKTELVYSQHAFRSHVDQKGELPVNAPDGHHFYLVTLPNANAQKKYFVAAPRGGKNGTPRIVTGFSKGTAMKFTSLRLAESFANFVNNSQIFPEGVDFWITMEHAGYQVGSTRLQLTSLAE